MMNLIFDVFEKAGDSFKNNCRIAITGQMHGMVLWTEYTTNHGPTESTELINWQDNRCSLGS